jgi:hypothetical protein
MLSRYHRLKLRYNKNMNFENPFLRQQIKNIDDEQNIAKSSLRNMYISEP